MKRLFLIILLLCVSVGLADQNMAKSTGLTPIEDITDFEQVKMHLIELQNTIDKMHRQTYSDINQINRDEIPALETSITAVSAKIDFDIPLVRDLNFVWNAGTSMIDWDEGTLSYQGTEYTISSGSSEVDDIAVYIDLSGTLTSPLTLDTTATPTVGDDWWYLASRLGTTVYEVVQSPIIHGGLIQGNTVDADTIDVGDVFAETISLTGQIYSGNSTYASNTALWLGIEPVSGDARLKLGDTDGGLEWDGTDLTVYGSLVVPGSTGTIPQMWSQDGPPTDVGEVEGDFWTDTNDGDTLYQYDGATWSATGGADGDDAYDWQGEWASGHGTYSVADAVENDGDVYYCIQAHDPNDVHPDIEPGTSATWTTYWDLYVNQGDDGDDGESFLFAGTWVDTTEYAKGHGVHYAVNGKMYIYTYQTPTTGNLPTDTSYWRLAAEKGDTGDTGDTGPQGPQGETGTGGGAQIFWQPGIPTSISVGDWWVDTDDSNKIYRAESVGATTIDDGEWVKEDGIFAKYLGAGTAFISELNVENGINIDTGGNIHSGQTAYGTGNGYWLGFDEEVPVFSIGDADDYLKWDGTDLISTGITGTSYTLTGSDITCDTLTAKTSVQVGEDNSDNSFNITSTAGVTKASSRYKGAATYYQTIMGRGGINFYAHSSAYSEDKDYLKFSIGAYDDSACYISKLMAGKSICNGGSHSAYKFYADGSLGRFGAYGNSTAITYDSSGVVDVPAAALTGNIDVARLPYVARYYTGTGAANTQTFTHTFGFTPDFMMFQNRDGTCEAYNWLGNDSDIIHTVDGTSFQVTGLANTLNDVYDVWGFGN